MTRHWSEETCWQPLGAVVNRLKRKVCEAIVAGDEFEAELTHDELISAEWRLRQAERLKEKARLRTNASGHDRHQRKGK